MAIPDPNPRHAGRGMRILRRAGIEVLSGVCDVEARDVLAPFTSFMLRGRPYVTLKLAASLDGRIADRTGKSKWITGPKARAFVQGVRRRVDAVLVGAGTVLKDDPSLLPRPEKGRRPFRVIVDAAGRVPASRRVFTDAAASRTIYATTRRCPVHRRVDYSAQGAQVWVLPSVGGGVSLAVLMKALHALGILHVLCEGGAEVASSLIRAKQVDEVILFVAPVVLGGNALGAVGGTGWLLKQAPRMRIVETVPVGNDVMIRAVIQKQ